MKIVIWLGAIALAIYTSFEVGRKYDKEELEKFLREEMVKLRFREKSTDNLVSAVMSRIKDAQVTPEAFMDIIKVVFKEAKEKAGEKFDEACDFLAGLTKDAQNGLSKILQEASEALKPNDANADNSSAA